jgi:hypothetical protein
MVAKAGQGAECVSSQSNSDSLLWFMVNIGDVSLYPEEEREREWRGRWRGEEGRGEERE